MLPQELSTDICSLRPQEDRLVLSCLMRIDSHGVVLGYEVTEGVIRSARRMTYTQVQAMIGQVSRAISFVFVFTLAAGVLAAWGILLTPAVGAVLMSASTVIVAINAQFLKRAEL